MELRQKLDGTLRALRECLLTVAAHQSKGPQTQLFILISVWNRINHNDKCISKKHVMMSVVRTLLDSLSFSGYTAEDIRLLWWGLDTYSTLRLMDYFCLKSAPRLVIDVVLYKDVYMRTCLHLRRHYFDMTQLHMDHMISIS